MHAATATMQKQRAGVIMNARKEISKADTLLTATPVNPTGISVSLMKLRDYQKRVQEFSLGIQGALTDTAQDNDIEKMSELDDVMLESIAQLESAKQDAFHAHSGQMPGNGAHNDSNATMSDHSRIRLPKIELRTYDGDPLKWDEFWDYYDNTFHSNDNIPVIEKFTYLGSILTGDALRLIEGYRLTAANYDEVVKALKDRFGDPEVAIFQHFDAMLTMPVSSGDVIDLQRVFDRCEAHIRSLIALDLSEETFGRVFAPILLSKLPGKVRVELIRKKGRGAWSLAQLRELLRDEINAQDMSKRSFGSQSNSKPADVRGSLDSRSNNSQGRQQRAFNNSGPRRGPHQYTASAMSNSERNNGSDRKQLVCFFCGGQHFNNKCTAYATAESRRQQMRGSCFICLGNGHNARDCNRKKPCFFCRSTTHHQSLCEKRFATAKSGARNGVAARINVATAKPSDATGKSITSSIMSHNGQRGVLQTAVADVAGSRCSMSARHMLDNGSDNSFININFAEKIGARCVGTETISLARFADAKRRQTTYKIYEFDICLRNGKRLPVKAYGTHVIICSIDKLAFDLEQNPVLTRLPLAEPLAQHNEHVDVDVLIGSDYYYDIIKTERIPLHDGLMLLDSEFGYVVAGRVQSSAKGASSTMLLSRGQLPGTNFDIERFWNLEEIGVKDSAESNDDEIALAKFNETVEFDGSEKRYMVKWPFKSDCAPLPQNYGLAFGRLKSMISRGNCDNMLVEKCGEIFRGQLESGIIEEAPSVPDGKLVHYLPHHAVIRPDKATTKVRVVYDASSRTNVRQPSLNDCVHRGPIMLENLCGLLLRFRLRKIGVTSDIEKAFLQVGLQKEDRDVTRFLWLRDTSKPCTNENLVHYRFKRVCFGVIASPFLLAATLTHHLKSIGTPVAEQIATNLYVDNVIDSKPSAETALEYYNEAKQIFQKASMNLREWYSNDETFVNAIPFVDRGGSSKTKVLGLSWDLASDTLRCPVGNLKSSNVITKRHVLHTIAKVYDPCGFFTPVTSPAKWLMQELWQRKYDWDTELSDDLIQRWYPIVENLNSLSKCAIPRCYGPATVDRSRLELHAFCDASAKAYCAAVYLLLKSNIETSSNLLISKCRVSPLKEQSIPRLELLAATIGTRLLEFVSKELRLPIDSKFLWSDSQCVLHWIVGKPVSTVFVRNRVAEIKKVPNVDFRYVPTRDNPADIPTRGLDVEDLKDSKLWWRGPDWLLNTDLWPEHSVKSFQLLEAEDVNTVSEGDKLMTMLSASVEADHPYPFEINRVSQLPKLMRVTGWVLRFIQNCRLRVSEGYRTRLRSSTKRSNVDVVGNSSVFLSSYELKQSKSIWERAVQKRHFQTIVSSSGSTHGKSMLLYKSLGPLFLNKAGIICCRGRLANAELEDDAKSPKLLPKNDPFTKLIITHYHEIFHHAGVKQTLAELRCEYWIINGRTQVKQVIGRCLLCQRQRGGSFEIPNPP